MGERIAVAMSGGVDSSVAAWLLQREGHELMGVTLRLFDRETPEGTCGASDDLADARAVAERLGMPHQVLDCRTCFRERVIRPFAAAYEAGCTPNPCVDCNRGIKFGELLRRSLELGAEAVATGHYVRMERDGATGRCLLKKALHPEKDQSYVLYSLTQEQLSRSRFPLGGLSKEEIRAIAARQGFGNAEKKESQDICFIPDGDYAAFLRRYMGREYPPGPFLDQNGRRLGTHEGIVSYTVGQRRGLGISSEGRLYVKELRPEDNAVVLSDNAALVHPRPDSGPAEPDPHRQPQCAYPGPRPVSATASRSSPAPLSRRDRTPCAWSSTSPSGRSPRARQWSFTTAT